MVKKQKTHKKHTNKGITLIALVITIIVMLILVAVVISMAINGGLFDYAGKAVGDTQNAIDAEQQLGSGKVQIDGVWYDSIDDYLAGKPSTETGDGEGGTEGNIQIELGIVGEKVTTVPIPTGFKHKEGTIDEGYVIINETDGNEFVWVPVDKNQRITLKVTSNKDIKSVTLKDPYGDAILTIEDGDVETIYNNIQIVPTVNGMYFATVKTEEETVQETLIVRSLYAMDTWNDWYSSDEGFKTQLKGTEYENLSKEEYFEMICEEEGLTQDELFQVAGIDSIDEFFMYSWREYVDLEDYTESVNNNGGFYIGRYEAGMEKAGQNVGANHTFEGLVENYGYPKSKEGLFGYKYTTFDMACGLVQGMYESTEYSVNLLTSAAWDRTLGWLIETKSKSLKEIVCDSTSWGNYYDSDFYITRGKYWSGMEWTDATEASPFHKEKEASKNLSTGASDRNCANNIYDLAGNYFEWVLSSPIDRDDRFCIKGGYHGVPKHDSHNVEFEPNVITTGSQLDFKYYSTICFRAAIYLQ